MNSVAYSFEDKTYMNNKESGDSFLIYLSRGISRLEKLGESIYLPKKHVLLESGQWTNYCYVVKRGRVISYELLANGEERIYHFHEKDSLFLEGNVLFGKPSTVGFKTACATELIRIHKTVLMNAIQSDPQIALDVIESASTKFQASMEQVRHVRNYCISWKICDVLLSLADYNGVSFGSKVLIKEKISQQMISNLLGVNRITTVRAMKDLKSRGLVEMVNGYYCINNLDEMIAYQQELEVE